MEKIDKTYARNRKEWRSWLQKNHLSKKGIWLIYHKKHTGRASVPYAEAVEEAICYGWIDGQIKKIDDERYMQRFTPRKANSLWSVINIERAKKMIELGYMTEPGRKALKEGTKTRERIPSSKNFSVPACLKAALSKNKKAGNNFRSFSPSAQLAYVYWVTSAKTEETRRKRIEKTVGQLSKNKKFGQD